MKCFFVIFWFAMTMSFTVSAQQKSIAEILATKMNPDEPGLPVKELRNHINSDVYIVDTIYKVQIVSKQLMYFYVGGTKVKPAVTVIFKGTDKQLNINRKEWANIGAPIHVSGKVILYNGGPAIIITNSDQLGTRIQI